MLITTAAPIYRTEILSCFDGYKTKIAPVPQGKEVEVDMLVPNPKTNYNWALKKVNESEEYDYLAYRIEG